MIPQAHLTAWRATVPWIDDAQVEQDLVLSRAVVELFGEPRLVKAIALRGGTALNKLHIRPACRYSEDIDLVQTERGEIGPVIDAIRSRLDLWLGKPARSRARGVTSLVYRFDSEIAPVRPLRLKIEINTREHFAILGYHEAEIRVDNPWFSGAVRVTSYALDELLATKLRALYQRRKGRDLFDLWHCLNEDLVNAERVVACFVEYMKREGHPVSRAIFEKNLREKQQDPGFLADVRPLLRADIEYDPGKAMAAVRQLLIDRLPGDPWRGANS